MFLIRWGTFFLGMMTFCLGITIAIRVQHLGIHPWDVLNVALSERVGLSFGSWAIIISCLLIVVSLILDKSYLKVGTFLNGLLVGFLVDMYLWLDLLYILLGIAVMGIGGGIYNAAGVGAGPRDGFMLSISDKLGTSIRKVRIITESFILLIGLVMGGPVFVFTFLFTFIQSPIFQSTYLRCSRYIERLEGRRKNKNLRRSSIAK